MSARFYETQINNHSRFGANFLRNAGFQKWFSSRCQLHWL